MYYSYVEIEYVATSFSPARTDLALKLLKPPQVQPFLDVPCSLTFRLWSTGTKLENEGNHWLIMAISARTLNILTTITIYKVGDKVLLINKGILRKAESVYGKEPWTITTVHTNGTIRIQCRTRTEQLSIRRVQPFTDDILKINQKYVRTISSIPCSPTLTKSYASLIVILSLHFQWPCGLWWLIFSVSRFFPHNFHVW